MQQLRSKNSLYHYPSLLHEVFFYCLSWEHNHIYSYFLSILQMSVCWINLLMAHRSICFQQLYLRHYRQLHCSQYFTRWVLVFQQWNSDYDLLTAHWSICMCSLWKHYNHNLNVSQKTIILTNEDTMNLYSFKINAKRDCLDEACKTYRQQ